MAKSARASSRKTNRTNLRNKVFGPVAAARLDRLSARLVARANAEKVVEKDAVGEDEVIAESQSAEGTLSLGKQPAGTYRC